MDLSGFEKDQLRKKYGRNRLSGYELDLARNAKKKKEEVASKMVTPHHKEIGNKLFAHKPTGKEGEYRTAEHTEYLEKMSPDERAKVNIHMGRLHRRKNK